MSALCTWCGTAYEPRDNGGKPQRFCSKDCRHDFFAACRAWAAREFEDGRSKICKVPQRNVHVATRGLQLRSALPMA